MSSYSVIISDADAEASKVLGRMRLDGVHQVAVPFDERCVRAWRRGAPAPDMDVQAMIKVLWLRYSTLYRRSFRDPAVC